MKHKRNTRINIGLVRLYFGRRIIYVSLFGSLLLLCSLTFRPPSTLSHDSGIRNSKLLKLLQDRKLTENNLVTIGKRNADNVQDSFENVREIYVGKIIREGIGAVVSNFRPVLQLAHHTGAVIVGRDTRSPHGYQMAEYIKLGKSHPNRKNCKLRGSIEEILINVSKHCGTFDVGSLEELGIFKNCNTVLIPILPPLKPSTCLKETIPLVYNFLQPKLRIAPKWNARNDVCVVKRGGDMEHRIAIGVANYTAIDEYHTLPILQLLKEKGARIVLITQTKREKDVLKKYNPDIFSNKEHLPMTFERLSKCRCLFIASGSSFAFLATIISSPTFIVHTEPAPDFQFRYPPYEYSEFGERAISVRRNRSEIVEKCFVQRKLSFFRHLF